MRSSRLARNTTVRRAVSSYRSMNFCEARHRCSFACLEEKRRSFVTILPWGSDAAPRCVFIAVSIARKSAQVCTASPLGSTHLRNSSNSISLAHLGDGGWGAMHTVLNLEH